MLIIVKLVILGMYQEQTQNLLWVPRIIQVTDVKNITDLRFTRKNRRIQILFIEYERNI